MDKREKAVELYKELKREYNMIWQHYNFCYKNESNDIWDAEHDALLFEADGVHLEMEEFGEEFNNKNYDVEGWLDGWARQIKRLRETNERRERYRLASIELEANRPSYEYC